MSDFSFDYWANLHKSSPEEFEKKRAAFLEAEILKAPVEHRNRLRVLQMECDAVRACHATPLAATVALSVMMTNKAAELRGKLTELTDIAKTMQ